MKKRCDWNMRQLVVIHDVEMYGTQTVIANSKREAVFENDVEMYGTQTRVFVSVSTVSFENDVEMYGKNIGNYIAKARKVIFKVDF